MGANEFRKFYHKIRTARNTCQYFVEFLNDANGNLVPGLESTKKDLATILSRTRQLCQSATNILQI